jgi:hypothetical protein
MLALATLVAFAAFPIVHNPGDFRKSAEAKSGSGGGGGSGSGGPGGPGGGASAAARRVAPTRAVIQIMEPALRALVALVAGRALALPARPAVVQALLGPALPGVRPAGRTRAGMEREVRARLLVAAAPVPGRAALGVPVRLAAAPAAVRPVGPVRLVPVRPLPAPLVRVLLVRLEAVRAEVRRLDRAALEQVPPLLAVARPAQEVVVQVLPPAAAPAEVRPADLARVA